MRPLVIVRPEPGASATAKAAEQVGLSVLVMPLFEIEAVAWRAPRTGDFDGLLLTSANAVRCGGDELGRLRNLPVHCVGVSTAAEAREAGFSIATIGGGGVDSLLALLPPNLRLLHLCGTDRREPDEPKQTIRAVAVYRAAELPVPQAFKHLGSAVIAVHSARSASRVAAVAAEAGLRREAIAIVAISGDAAAAAAAAGDGWQSVTAVGEPTDTALLALAASLCNNR